MKTFKYHGLTFRPVGKTTLDFFGISKRIESDRDLGLSVYKWHKGEKYNYDEFYKASGDSCSDLFMCVDNGNVYIPGKNELFKYNTQKCDKK